MPDLGMILPFAILTGQSHLNVDQHVVEIVILEKRITICVLCDVEIIDRSGRDAAHFPVSINPILRLGVFGLGVLVFASQRVNALLTEIVLHAGRFEKLFTRLDKRTALSHHISLDNIDIAASTGKAVE